MVTSRQYCDRDLHGPLFYPKKNIFLTLELFQSFGMLRFVTDECETKTLPNQLILKVVNKLQKTTFSSWCVLELFQSFGMLRFV